MPLNLYYFQSLWLLYFYVQSRLLNDLLGRALFHFLEAHDFDCLDDLGDRLVFDLLAYCLIELLRDHFVLGCSLGCRGHRCDGHQIARHFCWFGVYGRWIDLPTAF